MPSGGGRSGGRRGTLGGLNKTVDGQHLGMFVGTGRVLSEGIIASVDVSFYPDEAGVTKQGDAECANLTVVQRALPGLERVTLKPQNPETHCNLTI